MTDWQAKDPAWEERVRSSFAAQVMMATLGAELGAIAPGFVEIRAPFRTEWTQQHGFLHAGLTTTLLDSACGYAAFSLMPAEAGVLAVDFQVNLLRPATGDLVARGHVLRPGRTINSCRGEAFVVHDGQETLVALMQSSIMTVTGRSDVAR